MFKDCRLARMSDGHYCIVRDLGPVKGGKGMKHQEVVVDFNLRGMAKLLKRALARQQASALPEEGNYQAQLREASVRVDGFRVRAGRIGS
jgi:hypothetical protein